MAPPLSKDELREAILFQNPHWEGRREQLPVPREEFETLKAHLPLPHIVALYGPRRVGKTTLMKQLIAHLLSQGVAKEHILYFSYDTAVVSPITLVREWEALVGKRLERGYLFLDEVQKLDRWAELLKVVYDTGRFKLFVSGSSSLSVRKGRESLAGRIVEVEIGALSYRDYLRLSGEAEGWESYQRYLRRQLPELALYPYNINEYVESLVSKVVWQDARELYGIERPDVLEGIFRFIAKEPGQIIRVEDVASSFGISRPTASLYLSILERSLLVRKLYNYSGNARKVEVRAKRYYPYFATLASPTASFGLLAETDVAEKLKAEFFYREHNREVDFVVVEGRKAKLAVEVKMSSRVRKREVATLLSFPAERKILVTAPTTRVEVSEVEAVPLHQLEDWLRANLKIK